MRFTQSILTLTLALAAVACSDGGPSKPPEPSVWDLLIADPNTDRNALYDRSGIKCADDKSGARPGCSSFYTGQKIAQSDDPYWDAGPSGNWMTFNETRWKTECDYVPYWDPVSETWKEEDICFDIPYYVTVMISPSGLKYEPGGRAINSSKSAKTNNGFIASNRGAMQKIRDTAQKYVAVYGMNRKTALNVAGQVLTVKANKGVLEEREALAQTIAAAFPKSLSTEEVRSAIDAAQGNDLSRAQALLDRLAQSDLSGMTPEQRNAFLVGEIGLGL